MRVKAFVVLMFILLSVSSGQAGNQKVLYTFTGGFDGSKPYAGVVFDQAGNLYGTTEWGGAHGQGTVFQLTPSPSGAWTETVLYSFTGGADGSEPLGGLAIDEAGNLYGTTAGGTSGVGCGALFKLSPSDSGWTFTVLHTFTGGGDGCAPASNLGYDGRLNGTTLGGGPGNYGTMFSLSTSGSLYWVKAFNGKNGKWPWGRINDWGYGTTVRGGMAGQGNVYESQPWATKIIHGFQCTGAAGCKPYGELVTQLVNGKGVMYGTTSQGGAGNGGAVYRLTPSRFQYDVWLLSVLHSFSGPDGRAPYTGLTADSAGNLYGTTAWGGAIPDGGTVFKLTPGPNGKWSHTILYSFTRGLDGGELYSGVVLDKAGNLYGTTYAGGAYDQGVIYEIVKTTGVIKPATLTFGPQPLQTTSPAQRISLFNPSPAPIMVTSVNVRGEFAVSANKCQNGVQPNTHCDVYITFTPTGTGTLPRTGSITFVDTAFNTPQSAQLFGTVPAASNTLLTTSGPPSFVGQPVTFTATVTSTTGTIPDGGLVTFSDESTTLGSAALASGTATYTTSALSARTHIIKASYAGDPAFASSTGRVVQVVDKYPTTTALSSIPNPSAYGQAVTFTVTVTGAGPPATGSVGFKGGTTGIGIVTLHGSVATLTRSNLTVGTHSITAQYLGDSTSDKSLSTVLNQVVQ